MDSLSEELLDVLEEYGTVVFGKRDCKGSAAMKKAMRMTDNTSVRKDGTPRLNGPHFVCCDASAEEKAICDQVGVRSFADVCMLPRLQALASREPPIWRCWHVLPVTNVALSTYHFQNGKGLCVKTLALFFYPDFKHMSGFRSEFCRSRKHQSQLLEGMGTPVS
jgi:hypothetical protein